MPVLFSNDTSSLLHCLNRLSILAAIFAGLHKKPGPLSLDRSGFPGFMIIVRISEIPCQAHYIETAFLLLNDDDHMNIRLLGA